MLCNILLYSDLGKGRQETLHEAMPLEVMCTVKFSMGTEDTVHLLIKKLRVKVKSDDHDTELSLQDQKIAWTTLSGL